MDNESKETEGTELITLDIIQEYYDYLVKRAEEEKTTVETVLIQIITDEVNRIERNNENV